VLLSNLGIFFLGPLNWMEWKDYNFWVEICF